MQKKIVLTSWIFLIAIPQGSIGIQTLVASIVKFHTKLKTNNNGNWNEHTRVYFPFQQSGNCDLVSRDEKYGKPLPNQSSTFSLKTNTRNIITWTGKKEPRLSMTIRENRTCQKTLTLVNSKKRTVRKCWTCWARCTICVILYSWNWRSETCHSTDLVRLRPSIPSLSHCMESL